MTPYSIGEVLVRRSRRPTGLDGEAARCCRGDKSGDPRQTIEPSIILWMPSDYVLRGIKMRVDEQVGRKQPAESTPKSDRRYDIQLWKRMPGNRRCADEGMGSTSGDETISVAACGRRQDKKKRK